MHWFCLVCVFATACWHDSKPAAAPAQPTPAEKPVKDLVQPVRFEKQPVAEDDDDVAEGDPCGGVVGGVYGGVVGGVVGGPPPPPPPPMPPRNVPPTALEANRIAGDKAIEPDDPTKVMIERSGKTRLVTSYKLCLDIAGTPAIVSMLKSSGYPAYDAKIMRTMRQWRYRPYLINGNAVPVCTAVTFVYSQIAPTPPAP